MSKKLRGLFDYEYQLELMNKHQPPLQKLNTVIDWEVFRSPIEEAFPCSQRPRWECIMSDKECVKAE